MSKDRKYYPYLDPTRIHPVPLMVRIRIGDVLLRGPITTANIEEFSNIDLTLGVPQVTWFIFQDLDNLGSPILTIDGEASQIFNSEFVLQQTGFQLQSGNVIGLQLIQGAEAGELLRPFDDEENLIPNAPTGQTQPYMFLYEIEEIEDKFVEEFAGQLLFTSLSFFDSTFNYNVEETAEPSLDGLILDGFTEE